MIPEVRHTTDFDRIAALPRRLLSQADAEAWAAALTPMLACEGSGAKLRPWQAYSLAEVAEQRGGWLALPVGLGKTLISYLLPRIMNAKRPILLIPATLREKTSADFASYAGHWRGTPPRRMSFQEMAPERGAKLLDAIEPDLIIIDEADDLSNSDSSAVRRIDRYVCAHEECAVVCMTGTPSRKSIMGYWHLLCWALRERAPVPLNEGEANMWAAALDEKPNRGGRRVRPGPLGRNLDEARAWYRERLAETPGVVIVDGDSCAQPLTVRVRLAPEDPAIDAHYQRFLVEQENPAGIPVSDPLSRWRIDGKLGCGVFEHWVPPPPDEWREARRNVARFVRDAIARSTSTSRPLDTEAQVLRRHADHPAVVAWREIKPTFEPNTEAVWLSSSAVRDVVAWLREDAAPGIVWCGCVELAGAIQAASRLSYYGPRGRDQHGRGLHVAPPDASLIASWHANKKGFNLQAWRRQLIVHPPQSAKWLEQIFGRSHRSGQTMPVTVDVLATSGGTLDGFETAIAEAGFARATVGLTQKILRATVVRARPTITASNRFRWARSDKR